MSISLGYIGIASKNPEDWRRLAIEVLGMMPARALPGEDWGLPGDPNSAGPASGGSGVAEDGAVYLKMDERQWRVAIHPSASFEGLLYLGFDADTQQGFDDAVRTLRGLGVDVEITPSRAAERSVRQLAQFMDPAGNSLELFWGPTLDRKFLSPTGARFVTGKLGWGHLNLFVANLEACYEFYTKALGFQLADYLVISAEANLSANFLYCNPRHHSVALTRVGDFNGVHHIMFELETIDEVGRIMDRVRRAGLRITSTLGRHVNDNMLSFYFRGPSGFDVEIGSGGLLIGDDWSPNQFCEGDVWGHHGLTPDAIAQMATEMKSSVK